MKKSSMIVFRFLLLLFATHINGQPGKMIIDLSGEWRFQVDSLDKGITEKWFNKILPGKISLPGSMTTNGKGNDISVNTPWTGSIIDSGWFTKPQYAQYRKTGNIKVPFWLQPVKYYKGAAWYQKKFIAPVSMKGKHIELFLERCHWETTVWLNGKEIGTQNSLATPDVFDITKYVSAGENNLTICVDNRIKNIDVGQNSHSISDHTQGNWNGMVGKLYIAAYSPVYIGRVDLFPDIEKKQVTVRMQVMNTTGHNVNTSIELNALAKNGNSEKIKPLSKKLVLDNDSTHVEIIYSMGAHPLLWDEFSPNLYTMAIKLLNDGKNIGERQTVFGMRKFSASGTQFTINGRLTFLRGTLECAIFPRTGYPPTDTAAWMRIFKICRAYGLNHMRFHSWCPPEAAFIAADHSGFYLQVECDSWANEGTSIGDGAPIDQFIYDESRRIVNSYGNHPSFCMMVYGNEPGGNNQVKYLTGFVQYWKAKDNRRLYTSGSGWPIISESDYNSTADPRIQAWGEGLKSIINSQAPSTDYDWKNSIAKWQHPTVSHEIGQWCVYPDFKEISKYTGVLKAKNFEIFQQTLADNGMKYLADSFLLASGKLQAICYKADIEAALRTPGFGGFQLLDLHDFPGQGTALVGVLNPFWEDKGYITAKEYSRFCNAVVPLARLKKLVYQNNEDLIAEIQIANFSAAEITEAIAWNIKNIAGTILFKGQFEKTKIPIGNSFFGGEIKRSLSSVLEPGRFILTVAVGTHENSWDFFVYPADLKEEQNDILITQQLDANALDVLNKGGKVLLTVKQGTVKPGKGGEIEIGFSSIFWNTAWTGGQPPVTLGILCNPNHPAFNKFPTQYHSNFQWQDAMRHANAIRLDSVAPGIQPILRVIDDWVTARPLGLLFECKIGKGKLLVSGIDLISGNDKRPEAKQLLYSLQCYMASDKFNPSYEGDKIKIMGLF